MSFHFRPSEPLKVMQMKQETFLVIRLLFFSLNFSMPSNLPGVGSFDIFFSTNIQSSARRGKFWSGRQETPSRGQTGQIRRGINHFGLKVNNIFFLVNCSGFYIISFFYWKIHDMTHILCSKTILLSFQYYLYIICHQQRSTSEIFSPFSQSSHSWWYDF